MDVLIVDDDASSLFIASSVIHRIDGADPIAFADPLEALRWLDGNVPELILIDHIMPELDGMHMLEHIRARPHLAEVPVVMITADASIELRVAALEHGCTDFLTKPIIIPELMARARNLLHLRSGQRLQNDYTAMLRIRVEEATGLLRRQAQELVNRLSRAAEFRNLETGMHLDRMALYARLIAEGMGLDADECRQIVEAAPMHDIGKVGIPDAILLKPGKLEPEEMAVMRQHTVIGHSILRDSEHALINLAADIALSHHERFDGAGYPHGLAGQRIPLAARIVAVADVFDALVTARPYKHAWTAEESAAYITANSGSQFDPDCAAAFAARREAVMEVCHAHPSPTAPAAT